MRRLRMNSDRATAYIEGVKLKELMIQSGGSVGSLTSVLFRRETPDSFAYFANYWQDGYFMEFAFWHDIINYQKLYAFLQTDFVAENPKRQRADAYILNNILWYRAIETHKDESATENFTGIRAEMILKLKPYADAELLEQYERL